MEEALSFADDLGPLKIIQGLFILGEWQEAEPWEPSRPLALCGSGSGGLPPGLVEDVRPRMQVSQARAPRDDRSRSERSRPASSRRARRSS